MKRIARVAAAAGATTLALGSCGPALEVAGAGDDDAEDFRACMVSDPAGWDDDSLNESGYRALQSAKESLGIDTQTAESATGSDVEANISSLVSSNCDLIFTIGASLAPATGTMAQSNPDTRFAIIDAGAQDEDGNLIEVDNVKPISFHTAEAAFLAGYLAAGMSETGTVATYGGMDTPTVATVMDGYVDGVAHYNQARGTEVEVLGWNKAAQDGTILGSDDDQSQAEAVSDELYNAGADIVMPVVGPGGAGTLASAREHDGATVIWVGSDGYQDHSTDPAAQALILTSVTKQIEVAVEDVTAASVADEFDNSSYVGTLENGGVSLAPFHHFEDQVPAQLRSELEQVRQEIVDGTIVVETPSAPHSG